MVKIQVSQGKAETTVNTNNVWDRIVALENGVTVPTSTALNLKADKTALDATNANVTANASLLADIVSLKQFGAKGDGATDDSTPLQLGLAYCITMRKALRIPGTLTGYLINTPCVANGRITIIGEGKGSNLINNVPSGQVCLTVDGSSLAWPYANGSNLKDFMITGNGSTCGHGLKLNYAAFSSLDTLWLWNNQRGLVMGITNIACNFSKIYCKYNRENGIDDSTWVNAGDANVNARFWGCSFENNNKGIYWKSDRVYVSQCMAEANALIDMHFVGIVVINQSYFEVTTGFTGNNLKLEGYKSVLNDCVINGNSVSYNAVNYNTTIFANRIMCNNVKGAAGSFKYTGTGTTNSELIDCDFSGSDTPLNPGTDNAIRSDNYNPIYNQVTIRSQIRIDNNPNGYLPIAGSVKPTSDQAYDLGDSTHNWFRMYGQEVYLKTYAHLGTVASLPATSSFYRGSLVTVRGSSGVDSTYICIQNDAGNYVWVNLTTSSGTTASRPTTGYIGMTYFDTTLGKTVWCKTVSPMAWVDATGATV